MNDYISIILFSGFLVFAVGTTASLIIEIFATVSAVKKQQKDAFYKTTLLAHIIEIQIHLLLLCIQAICMIFILKGGYDMELLTDILINVGCSIVTSVVLTVIVYFKFLKNIPEQTKKSIDDLLNTRLGYETANHNAALENTNIAKEALSREHSEIRQNISSVSKDIVNIKGELRTERKLKDLQYNYLKGNDRALVDSINKLNVLGESLQKVNYENKILRAENEKLKSENEQLNFALSAYKKSKNKFTQHM